MRAHVSTESEHRVEVNLHNLVEINIWEFFDGVSFLNSRARHQDADLMAVFEDLGRESCDVGLGGEFGGVDPGFSVEGFDGLFGGLV